MVSGFSYDLPTAEHSDFRCRSFANLQISLQPQEELIFDGRAIRLRTGAKQPSGESRGNRGL